MNNLELLLAGYLHQDWRYEYQTWHEAVDDFIGDYPKEASLAAEEIGALVARDSDPQALTDTLMALGAAYDPESEGQTVVEWLFDVRDRIAQQAGP